jgi:hypothetical protein
MAKLNQSILGNPSGSIGNFTFVKYNDQIIIRSKPSKTQNPPTERQLFSRKRFGILSEISTHFDSIIRIAETGKNNINPRGNFISYSKEAISGNSENPVLDFSKLIITRGILETPNSATATYLNQSLTIDWELSSNHTNNDDTIVMCIYFPELKKTFLLPIVTRFIKTITMEIPPSAKKKSGHVYTFASNHKMETSDTLYLGLVDCG